jgi:hypothetical protein
MTTMQKPAIRSLFALALAGCTSAPATPPKAATPASPATRAALAAPADATEQRAAEAGETERFHFIREGETFALPGS